MDNLGYWQKTVHKSGESSFVRADSQWCTFSREVDEAVQLTSLGSSGTGA